MVTTKTEDVINNRISWVDIAKGLLILIVVWGHVPSIALSQRLGLHHEGLDEMGKLMFVFNCFFMHAFFVLTGYTTNFKKNFLDFFFSSLKSLIIPAFCFSIITCLLYGLLFQDLYFNTPAVVSYHRCQLPATEGAVSEVVQYAKSFHQVHTRYTLNTLLSISYHKFPVIFPCGSVLQPFTTHNGFQASSFQ